MAQHICRETAHKLFESPYRCIDSYLSAGNFLILKHDATMRKGLNNEETQGICEAVSFDVTAECDTGFDELPQILGFYARKRHDGRPLSDIHDGQIL